MTQDGWQVRLTGVVADEIRRVRAERKMSAQQLADRCEQLGLPIPRPVLSNLENGRRESVSIAELMVLARALEVSPITLIVPVGQREAIEVSPGRNARTWDAFRWFVGEARLQESDARLEAVPTDHEPQDAIRLFREHDVWLERWRDAAVRLGDWRARWPEILHDPAQRRVIEAEYDSKRRDLGRVPTQEDLAREWEGHLREREGLARRGLHSVREALRQAELTLPPLPPELTNLPGERAEESREFAHDRGPSPEPPSAQTRRQAEREMDLEAGG
jgi:transcriptional regulator with XRE-family HTH domain